MYMLNPKQPYVVLTRIFASSLAFYLPRALQSQSLHPKSRLGFRVRGNILVTYVYVLHICIYIYIYTHAHMELALHRGNICGGPASKDDSSLGSILTSPYFWSYSLNPKLYMNLQEVLLSNLHNRPEALSPLTLCSKPSTLNPISPNPKS